MKKQAQTTIPTQWGNFNMVAYSADVNDPMPHLAMVHEDFDPKGSTLVRIHSECLTGDLFSSKRCDCGEQLDESMRQAAQQGGVVIYLRQEGRGIGLINKLKAYNLQDDGLNTIDANTHLGLEVDSRHYAPAISILKDLAIQSVNLLTNNPLKIEAIEKSDIKVNQRLALVIPPKAENLGYLKTKEELMGHLFHINGKIKSVS